MERRLELQAKLEAVQEDLPVYFQAPHNTGMKYPCLLYAFDSTDVKHADNKPYQRVKRWKITVIDEDPDSEIPDKLAALPTAVHRTSFVKENLHHHVYYLSF